MSNRGLYALRIAALLLMAGSLAGAQQARRGSNLDYPVARALDADGNGEISAAEVADARAALAKLDKNGDGKLSQEELGGPGPFFGWLRLQTTIRVIDRNGDCEISSEELTNAPERLKHLDHDRNWVLSNSELFESRAGNPGAALGMGPAGGAGGRPGGPGAAPGGGLPPGGMIARMLGMMLNAPRDQKPIPFGADPRAFDGYMLYTESNIAADVQVSNGTFLLDNKGKVVHEWKSERGSPEGASAYLLANGLLARQVAPDDWVMMEHFPVGSHGIVELVDWDGKVVWQYQRCVIDKHCLHHDFQPLPNGNFLVVSYEALTPEEVAAVGRKPEQGLRWFEKILEIKPNLKGGSSEIVWQWNSLDHLIQDVDPSKPNYGSVADNPNRIDINARPNPERQFHMNSIDYNPELDQILVSSATYGEVWVIDHSTRTEEAATGEGGRYGHGGRLLYRWGNPAMYKSGGDKDRVLQGQHDARWLLDLPGAGHTTGHITIHNNTAGPLPNPGQAGPFGMGRFYSSVVELKMPLQPDGSYKREPGEPFEGEVVWKYVPNPLESWFAPFMSGASRLPNRNTLIVNSYVKRIFEVTPSGEQVVNYYVPGPGRIFRVYKLPTDHPGLKGRL